MLVKRLVGLIKNKKKQNRTRIEIEELKKALVEDTKFRDGILRELEYRTGRRDILKLGILGLLGLSVSNIASSNAKAQPVNSDIARETISDYSGIKLPKPCTCIVSQDGTGDYNVSSKEDASGTIQKAINYAHSKGGGEVRIREGQYISNKDIQVFQNIAVVGCSPRSTIIRATRNVDNIFTVSGGDDTFHYATIKNVFIDGRHISNGIKVSGGSKAVEYFEVSNCKICRCTSGLVLDTNIGDARILNNEIINVGYGIMSNGQFINSVILGNHLRARLYNIYLASSGANGCRPEGVRIAYNYIDGWFGCRGVVIQYGHENDISHNIFDNYVYSSIVLEKYTNGTNIAFNTILSKNSAQEPGISIKDKATFLTVTYNRVGYFCDYGISVVKTSFGEPSNIIISNNVITNSKYGINCNCNTKTVHLINNIIG